MLTAFGKWPGDGNGSLDYDEFGALWQFLHGDSAEVDLANADTLLLFCWHPLRCFSVVTPTMRVVGNA